VPKAAGGAATLSFYCMDSAGHVSVEVRIASDHRGKTPAQSVLLVAAVEPAAVDSFVSDLSRVEADQQGTAFPRTSG
jgi:Pyruvate/2-oxoacid:ferredoxin oxidoreductase gamma subunit